MKTRIITALVGIPLVFIIVAFYQTIAFNLVVDIICLIAIHEAISAFKIKNGNILFISFIPLVTAIMFKSFAIVNALLFPIAFLTLMFFAVFILINFENTNIANIGGSLLLSIACVICFYSVLSFKTLLPNSYDGIYLILLCLAFAWGGDGTAYFVGIKFGKRKLCEKISPKKTIEGAIGALFGSAIIGVLITFCYDLIRVNINPDNTRFSLLFYLAIATIGVVSSVLGMMGDLFASTIKRQMNIKDYGSIMPGHGGVLDRFDSVIFITPLIASILYIIRIFEI